MNQIDLFPDTNIFLHYPPIDQVDWKSLTGFDSVRIVLCLEVIRELDEKKNHSTLSGRASQAIKVIRNAETSEAEIRPGVTVAIFPQSIRREEFSSSLSPDEGDERIIHLVQKYQKQNPDRNIAIATEDLGMEIRCRASDTQLIRMDKSLRLENPQDEQSKKHKQVLQELAAYKNRLPKLDITASNHISPEHSGSPIFELERKWMPLDIDKEMERIVREVPKYEIQPASDAPVGSEHEQAIRTARLRMMEQLGVSDAQRYEFNRQVDGFRQQYREHFELQNLRSDALERTLFLDFDLANSGTCMATELDIVLAFPADIVNVLESGSKDATILEEPLPAPLQPKKPRGLVDRLGGFDPIGRQNYEIPDLSDFRMQSDHEPSITCVREDDGCKITGHLKKLKHVHSVRLGTFLVVLRNYEQSGPFNILCKITCPELPDAIYRTIPVIVKRKAPNSGP